MSLISDSEQDDSEIRTHSSMEMKVKGGVALVRGLGMGLEPWVGQ
jgi:hypothetical protein